MDAELFVQAAKALGVPLSDVQLEAFGVFEQALYEANEVMNLTRVSREECWRRHFVDSILIQDLIPLGASVLDIGTGPGFPAWPIACARPDLSVTALDSNRKMLGFLKTQPLPNLQVVNARAEEWTMWERFDFLTGRALAPLPAQLEISARLCKVDGLVVPMRTLKDKEAAGSIKADVLGLQFDRAVQRELPDTDVVRLFPIYVKVKKTNSKYPRRWSEILRSPLE